MWSHLIPCGIGIGQTKTLAKLANHIAKTAERKPGSYPEKLAQVCNLAALSALRKRAAGGEKKTALAREFGVSRETVHAYLSIETDKRV